MKFLWKRRLWGPENVLLSTPSSPVLHLGQKSPRVHGVASFCYGLLADTSWTPGGGLLHSPSLSSSPGGGGSNTTSSGAPPRHCLTLGLARRKCTCYHVPWGPQASASSRCGRLPGSRERRAQPKHQMPPPAFPAPSDAGEVGYSAGAFCLSN
jgi:hypothetical protein